MFFAIIGVGKEGRSTMHIPSHGLLTMQMGLTHLHNGMLCVGPTHQNQPHVSDVLQGSKSYMSTVGDQKCN